MKKQGYIDYVSLWGHYVNDHGDLRHKPSDSVFDCADMIRVLYDCRQEELYATASAKAYAYHRILNRKMGIFIVNYLGKEHEWD